MKHPTIIVVGAGVSGLTSAISLVEAGFAVQLWAAKRSPHTTSDRAGAVWYPHFSEPLSLVVEERVTQWLKTSFETFASLATEPDKTGCVLAPVIAMTSETVRPPWTELVPGFTEEIRPDGQRVWSLESPRIDVTMYMRYLWRRLYEAMKEQDVWAPDVETTVKPRHVVELLVHGCIVVNCTGLGARRLVGDTDVYPERGQTVIVRRSDISGGQDLNSVRLNGSSFSYLIPRKRTIVFGGTSQRGRSNKKPDFTDRHTIVENCSRIWPELGLDAVSPLKLRDNVGLRPMRTGGPRVECVTCDGGHLIHNYGHGHNGFNLSWGCAATVVDLVREIT